MSALAGPSVTRGPPEAVLLSPKRKMAAQLGSLQWYCQGKTPERVRSILRMRIMVRCSPEGSSSIRPTVEKPGRELLVRPEENQLSNSRTGKLAGQFAIRI